MVDIKTVIERFQEINPKFNLKFKNESLLMKIISKILFFNKSFFTSFVTTLGNTVYFPSRENLERRGRGAILTLGHEFIHTYDFKKYTYPLFSFLYLFPQSLAPFMLLFSFVYWWLGIILFLACLAPLPAPWRTYFEVRGYAVSLLVLNRSKLKQGLSANKRRHYLLELSKNINIHFTNSSYYFMWPFGVSKKLEKISNKIVSDEFNEKIYNDILNIYEETGTI